MTQLVFIAIPTKGTVVNGAISERFLRHLAELHIRYPNKTFWCPMVQDYQLLKYMPPDVDATWEVWGQHCRRMIEACDIVWVMMYDGWQDSVGVTGEIKHATAYRKQILYFDPKTLDD